MTTKPSRQQRLHQDTERVLRAPATSVVLLAWAGTVRTTIYSHRGSRRRGRRLGGGLPAQFLLARTDDALLLVECEPRWGGVRPTGLLRSWPLGALEVSWTPGTPAHAVTLRETTGSGWSAQVEAPDGGPPDSEVVRALERLVGG